MIREYRKEGKCPFFLVFSNVFTYDKNNRKKKKIIPISDNERELSDCIIFFIAAE